MNINTCLSDSLEHSISAFLGFSQYTYQKISQSNQISTYFYFIEDWGVLY